MSDPQHYLHTEGPITPGQWSYGHSVGPCMNAQEAAKLSELCPRWLRLVDAAVAFCRAHINAAAEFGDKHCTVAFQCPSHTKQGAETFYMEVQAALEKDGFRIHRRTEHADFVYGFDIVWWHINNEESTA